jgi:hypothetical protein
MKRVLVLLSFLSALSAVTTADAQDFYPDFALVVQLPSYETFLTNLGGSPIRVDHYEIRSDSGSLSLSGWASLDSAGPEIVDALGPEADQFEVIGAITPQILEELNLFGWATWQPGQSWSIGFPFDSDDPDFVLDPIFRFSSPDGFTQSGGTVIDPDELGRGAFSVIPDLPGDFNYDGTVDAADYVVWRKGLGTTYTQDDFNTWRANFGTTLYPGGGAMDSFDIAAPEPGSHALLLFLIIGVLITSRGRIAVRMRS